ncbi:intraflagellar transport protein 20 homolog [Egretta garzetta]|nr:intraflagellar transport protein 20 homolog [Egretta garzetta]
MPPLGETRVRKGSQAGSVTRERNAEAKRALQFQQRSAQMPSLEPSFQSVLALQALARFPGQAERSWARAEPPGQPEPQSFFFFAEIVEFQKIVGSLIELVDQLAKAAESEKMKAIGARNLLKSIAKQREAQEQQLQALIAEKKVQLERYQIEYETLCKIEADQNEFIDQFIFQK